MGSLFPALWEAHSRQLASRRVERVPTKRRRSAGVGWRGKEERQKRRQEEGAPSLVGQTYPGLFRQLFKIGGVLIRASMQWHRILLQKAAATLRGSCQEV